MARTGTTALRISSLLLAAVALVGVSGCSDAPFLAGEETATPTPTATPVTPGKTEVILNDLATGSAKRDLEAGNIALSIVYYSDLTMDKWTAEANTPITLSLKASLTKNNGEKVYLSRVTATPAVTGPAGALAAPAPSIDSATVSPGYFVKSPYSYSTTFIMPAVDPTATSITVSFTYELLLQTTRTSKAYSKQSASDTLTIAIAQPAE